MKCSCLKLVAHRARIKDIKLDIIKCGEDYTPIAFVLINTEIGSESEVLEALKKIDAVEEAYLVYGVYDIVAKVEADTMGRLKEIVTWHVRRLNKVRSTTTMMGAEEKK